MKRVAILVCGEYREFDIALKSWKFMVDDNILYDFYMSTWNISSDWRDPESDIEVITYEKICEFIKFKNVSIYPVIDNMYNVRRFIYLIKSGIRMMIQSGVYDSVMVIRPNLWLQDSMNSGIVELFNSVIADNIMYNPTDSTYEDNVPHIEDAIWICNQRTMISLLELPDTAANLGMQWILGKFVVDKNIISKMIPGSVPLVIVRPGCRCLAEYSDQIIHENTIKWWNKMHPYHQMGRKPDYPVGPILNL